LALALRPALVDEEARELATSVSSSNSLRLVVLRVDLTKKSVERQGISSRPGKRTSDDRREEDALDLPAERANSVSEEWHGETSGGGRTREEGVRRAAQRLLVQALDLLGAGARDKAAEQEEELGQRRKEEGGCRRR